MGDLVSKLFSCLAGGALMIVAGGVVADTGAPIGVQAFFSAPAISDAKISPDGKYLAMVVADGASGEGRRYLAIIGVDDHDIKSGFQTVDRQVIMDFWWGSSTRVLIATGTDTGSLSFATGDGHLYGVNVDKSAIVTLLSGYISAMQGTGHSFYRMLYIPHEESNHVVVQVEEDSHHHDQAMDIDIYSGATKLVASSPASYGEFGVDREGNVRLAWGQDAKTGAHEVYYRNQEPASSWKDLSSMYAGADVADDASHPDGMTPDGKSFYWYGRTSVGTMGLFTVDPNDGKEQSLFSDPGFDVERWTRDMTAAEGGRIVAVQTDPGLPETHILAPDDGRVRVIEQLKKAFPGQEIRVTSSTRDGSKMVVFVTSDRDPGNFYLVDSKTLKADYLFGVLEQIAPAKMAPMQPVTIDSRDGMTLHGYLTTPVGVPARNLPLIVLPHGGPHGLRDHWGWNSEVQFFAYHGYAVLQVNYRGSGGYGMKFQDLGYRHWGTTMLDDLADSVRWATQQGIVDPKRVCIYGASYGGYAALESVIRYQDLYKCAAGYVGVYDLTLQAQYGDTHQFASGRRYLDTVLGDDQDDLKAHSPVYNVGDINVPVFIAYGGKDQRVVPDNAKELIAAMDEAGKRYESPLFDPYETHGFIKPEHRFELYTRMLAFFDGHIGPNAVNPGVAADNRKGDAPVKQPENGGLEP